MYNTININLQTAHLDLKKNIGNLKAFILNTLFNRC